MRKLLFIMLLLPLFAHGQIWNQVSNTLQRQTNGTYSNYRFNLGSPGFFYVYSKAQVDSLIVGIPLGNYYTKTQSDAKFVPYTSANSDVNIGTHSLTANSGIFNGSLSAPSGAFGLTLLDNERTISKSFVLRNTTNPVDANNLTLTGTSFTGVRSQTFQDKSGTVALTSDISSLTTSDVPEGSNLYFTNSRARTAFSTVLPLRINFTTGSFSIDQATTSQSGYLSNTDWNTFNSKQGSFTLSNGSVPYWSGSNLTQDNSNFNYDAANARLNLIKLHVNNPTVDSLFYTNNLAPSSLNGGLRVSQSAGEAGFFTTTGNANVLAIQSKYAGNGSPFAIAFINKYNYELGAVGGQHPGGGASNFYNNSIFLAGTSPILRDGTRLNAPATRVGLAQEGKQLGGINQNWDGWRMLCDSDATIKFYDPRRRMVVDQDTIGNWTFRKNVNIRNGGKLNLMPGSLGLRHFNPAFSDTTTNAEYLNGIWSGNAYYISTQSYGTGIARSLILQSGSNVSTNPSFIINQSAASTFEFKRAQTGNTDALVTFFNSSLPTTNYLTAKFGKSTSTNESGIIGFVYNSSGNSSIAICVQGDDFNGAGTGARIFKGGFVGIGVPSPNATDMLQVKGSILSGIAGSSLGTIRVAGNTSGTVSIIPQAAAGTYNFNLPITAGSAGQVLTSQGGGSTAMTWSSLDNFSNYTASGNGSSTTIAVPHGLSGISTTSKVIVQALNAASAGVSYVTIDATNVNIVYTVAPASGTNNLSYTIEIKP